MTKAVMIEARGTKKGTAQRQAGKDTAAKLVRTAYELLLKGGYDDFSMRNIAERAGVRLANLQYYYPKKENLIRALNDYVGEMYDNRYEECLANAGKSPIERFTAAMELNFDDVNNLETRHFFIQLWPLLGMADNYSGKLLAEIYTYQHKQVASLIMELCPEIDSKEANMRAEVISALIEGLMVTVVSVTKGEQAFDELKEVVMRNVLAIAKGQ